MSVLSADDAKGDGGRPLVDVMLTGAQSSAKTVMFLSLGCFAFASVLVWSSATRLSPHFLDPNGHHLTSPTSTCDLVIRADGRWYRQIVRDGYTFDPCDRSSVAFFPLYPLLGRVLSDLTGLDPGWSLLVISNIALILSFVLLTVYARGRDRRNGDPRTIFVLYSFAIVPVGFFFHFAYSESLFLLLLLLAFVGMQREWPLVLIAVSVGLATACRPVGVVLVLVFVVHLWAKCVSLRSFTLQLFAFLPLCFSGLIIYSAFLWIAFDDPLAFFQTQRHWSMVSPVDAHARLLALATFEPIWGCFDSASPFCWPDRMWGYPQVLSAPVMDRVLFLLGTAGFVVGWTKRWLDMRELILVAGLMGIPYLTRAYEMSFYSQGRFTSVAFPLYLIAGRLLASVPPGVSLGIVSLMASTCAAYTALFAAGFAII
jgi:hypothetical protein